MANCMGDHIIRPFPLRSDPASSFLPRATYAGADGANRSLSYSYETCGKLNNYDAGAFEATMAAQVYTAA